MTRRTLASSSMRFDFVWRRPAVSAMRMSAWRATAASSASNTTAAGSALGAWATISESVRWAQIRSWSMAAARNVSAAARTTRRPLRPLAGGELADGRGLAGAVDADDEDDGGRALDGRDGLPVLGVADGEQAGELVADGLLGGDVAALARALDEVHRQGGPDVAGDQRLLDLLPVRPAGHAERAAEPGAEPGAGLLEAVLELLALALAAGGVGLLGAVVGAPGPLDLRLGLGRGLGLGDGSGLRHRRDRRPAADVELGSGRRARREPSATRRR